MRLTEEEARNWQQILEEADRPFAEAEKRRKAEEARLKDEAEAQRIVRKGCLATVVILLTIPLGLVGIVITTFVKALSSTHKKSRGPRRHR
ncbi:hypothetical protein M0R72_16655 [Candidatus Pacearchaeota archaeon]|jgi:cytochrome c-type biogenesis protein CcmH/NrfG|nr:hypothetical protein [Candidatus Pacearchaeota archaeon]